MDGILEMDDRILDLAAAHLPQDTDTDFAWFLLTCIALCPGCITEEELTEICRVRYGAREPAKRLLDALEGSVLLRDETVSFRHELYCGAFRRRMAEEEDTAAEAVEHLVAYYAALPAERLLEKFDSLVSQACGELLSALIGHVSLLPLLLEKRKQQVLRCWSLADADDISPDSDGNISGGGVLFDYAAALLETADFCREIYDDERSQSCSRKASLLLEELLVNGDFEQDERLVSLYWAKSLTGSGDFDEAENVFQELLTETFDAADDLFMKKAYAELLMATDRPGEAEKLYVDIYEFCLCNYGDEDVKTVNALYELSLCQIGQEEKFSKSLQFIGLVYESRKRFYSDAHVLTVNALSLLAQSLERSSQGGYYSAFRHRLDALRFSRTLGYGSLSAKMLENLRENVASIEFELLMPEKIPELLAVLFASDADTASFVSEIVEAAAGYCRRLENRKEELPVSKAAGIPLIYDITSMIWREHRQARNQVVSLIDSMSAYCSMAGLYGEAEKYCILGYEIAGDERDYELYRRYSSWLLGYYMEAGDLEKTGELFNRVADAGLLEPGYMEAFANGVLNLLFLHGRFERALEFAVRHKTITSAENHRENVLLANWFLGNFRKMEDFLPSGDFTKITARAGNTLAFILEKGDESTRGATVAALADSFVALAEHMVFPMHVFNEILLKCETVSRQRELLDKLSDFVRYIGGFGLESVLLELGLHQQAIEYFQRLFRLYGNVFGVRQHCTLELFDRFLYLLMEKKLPEEALKTAELWPNIYKEPPLSPALSLFFSRYASSLHERERKADAAGALKLAWELNVRIHGRSGEDALVSMLACADYLKYTGAAAESEKIFREAFTLMSRHFSQGVEFHMLSERRFCRLSLEMLFCYLADLYYESGDGEKLAALCADFSSVKIENYVCGFSDDAALLASLAQAFAFLLKALLAQDARTLYERILRQAEIEEDTVRRYFSQIFASGGDGGLSEAFVNFLSERHPDNPLLLKMEYAGVLYQLEKYDAFSERMRDILVYLENTAPGERERFSDSLRRYAPMLEAIESSELRSRLMECLDSADASSETGEPSGSDDGAGHTVEIISMDEENFAAETEKEDLSSLKLYDEEPEEADEEPQRDEAVREVGEVLFQEELESAVNDFLFGGEEVQDRLQPEQSEEPREPVNIVSEEIFDMDFSDLPETASEREL